MKRGDKVILFDLLEVIKDTDRPLLILYKEKLETYSYREAAIDSMIVSLHVASLTIVSIGGVIYYSIKLRDN